ncbi:MAG: hypothetical protein MUE48_01720 [Desulfobacterales bacterium]|jgi:hypothetical protein|nr:hypothetical protein [Desulfobacterales bacterium]
MIALPPAGDKDRNQLLSLLGRLGEADRATLLAFAEFLAARAAAGAESATPPPPQQLNLLPRPPSESVVAAIRRLSASYPMLDRRRLLNLTSTRMTQHILHGRPAAEVIDELEQVFAAEYQALAGPEAGTPPPDPA